MKCIIRKENEKYTIYNYSTGKFYILPSNVNSLGYFNNIKDFDLLSLELKDSEFIKLIEYKDNTFDIENFKSPIVAGLMVSNYCNLNCIYCISHNGGAYTKDVVLNDNIDYLINELWRAKIMGVLVSGGEPTLNPRLSEILIKLAQNSFYITLDSNGILLDDDIIYIIEKENIIPRISLDSPTAEIHNKYRGGFDKSLENIKNLIKKGVDVRINTVLHNENVGLLEDMAKFLCDLGIKQWHIFKLQSVFAPPKLLINDSKTEKLVNDTILKYDDKMRIICKFIKNNDGFASFVIDPALNCFSTNNIEKKKIQFGNILNKSIIEIWEGLDKEYRVRHVKKYLGIPEVKEVNL